MVLEFAFKISISPYKGVACRRAELEIITGNFIRGNKRRRVAKNLISSWRVCKTIRKITNREKDSFQSVFQFSSQWMFLFCEFGDDEQEYYIT
jgi:hypothetical protein